MSSTHGPLTTNAEFVQRTTRTRRDFLWAALGIAMLALVSTLSQAGAPTQPHASIPGRKLMLNAVSYHVGDQGSGPKVVLLLHGMPDTSAVWRRQVDALVQAGYRVIVPDMLGYGDTDKPQDPQRYRGELIIADLIAMLDALELKQVDVVGHDWGAFASWELVLNFPERFRRHVALSIGHPESMLVMTSIGDVEKSWYMYLNTQADAAALYAQNDGAFLKQFFMPTHPELGEVWERMKDPVAMNGMLNWDKANPMASGYLAASTIEGKSRRCKVPTLGIWSSGDTYLFEKWMTGSAALMSAEWRYERIEGASHWLMLDRPEQVNAFLLDWLKHD